MIVIRTHKCFKNYTIQFFFLSIKSLTILALLTFSKIHEIQQRLSDWGTQNNESIKTIEGTFFWDHISEHPPTSFHEGKHHVFRDNRNLDFGVRKFQHRLAGGGGVNTIGTLFATYMKAVRKYDKNFIPFILHRGKQMKSTAGSYEPNCIDVGLRDGEMRGRHLKDGGGRGNNRFCFWQSATRSNGLLYWWKRGAYHFLQFLQREWKHILQLIALSIMSILSIYQCIRGTVTEYTKMRVGNQG